MTNFEKIKAMNIEEMANAMSKEIICGCCPLYYECKYTDLAAEYGIKIENGYEKNENCKEKIQKWLESEVK